MIFFSDDLSAADDNHGPRSRHSAHRTPRFRASLLLAAFFAFAPFMFHAPREAAAHETRTPLVIDTDAALDDIRAIALLLQDEHFEIVAIVTSDGACSPLAGATVISKALTFTGRDDIPVAAGSALEADPPPWREMSEQMGGTDLPPLPDERQFADAIELLGDLLGGEGKKMIYLCLGPLTNLATLLQTDSAAAERISSVYYYGLLPGDAGGEGYGGAPGKVNPAEMQGREDDTAGESWNTARDVAAARIVAGSNLEIYCCSQPARKSPAFDRDMFDKITSFDSRFSSLVNIIHSNGRAADLLDQGHFRAWDETAALCLIEPYLCDFISDSENGHLHRLDSFDIEGARNIYIDTYRQMDTSPASRRKTVVFEHFPRESSMIRSDLAPLVDKIIDRHGIEEWRACVLTNELHRHLGIYSILGVKMGLRAREILSATLDDLEVKSFAGLKPPLSCMNDGLQVSTGASLGRGTISVECSAPSPEALFTARSGSVRLRLKDAVVTMIRNDIAEAIREHGNLTPEYFARVRELSLRYWIDIERGEIFETVEE